MFSKVSFHFDNGWRIEQLFVVHSSPADGRVTENKVVIANNKVWDTHLFAKIHDQENAATHFSPHQNLTDNQTPWQT